VVGDDQELLLVKRSVEPQIGQWCLPGGFIELGESPEQAALRELKEETGLSGKIDKLLGVTSHSSDMHHTILIIGYLVRHYTGIPEPGDDASEVAYFSPDGLPTIAFESHVKFIQLYYPDKVF
jgi:ADP-ribose pyrophosphatase YjhB (NUDIX family)